MKGFLLALWVVCVATVVSATEDEGIITLTPEQIESMTIPIAVYTAFETSCIVTVICGDATEDSNVRCVRTMVCGEAVE